MKTLLFYFIILISLGQAAFSQNEITGKVMDENLQPIPSASVAIANTTRGTYTDFDGVFTIEASPGEVLKISYLGFLSTTVTIGSKNNYQITLKEDTAKLDEIVIVGYGAKKKSSITGAVSTVQAKELTQAPTTTATELLAGRIPGLITKQTTGIPGADATSINIRGFGNALILVDGLQTPMDRVDPNDIETMTVLKDGAAAVYGSRAGNGVVLITTKRGKIGKPKISLHTSTSFQQPTQTRNTVDSWDYATLVRESDLNGGGSLDDTYTMDDVEKFRAGNDPNFVNEDWDATVFKNWTPMMQHSLSVRGGNENVKYFTSLGLLDQESAFRSGDLNFSRYNARSNVDVQLNKKLSVGVDISYRRENRNSPGTNLSSIYQALKTAQPVYPAFLPDATRAAYSGFGTRSPYAATSKEFAGFDDFISERLIGRFELKYKFDFGLSAKAVFNYETLNDSEKSLRKSYNVYSYDYDTDTYTDLGIQNSRSSISETYRKRIQMYPLLSLEYNKKIGDHSLDALALVESIDYSNDEIEASRFDLVSTDIPYLSSGSQDTQENNSFARESGRQSYVTRLNYNYKNKYFLETTMRADATGEKFSPENRWGYFPSVSASWRLSEEKFLENFYAMNNLKLRLSYSQTGLDNVGDFRYLTGYNILDSVYLIDDNAGQIIQSNGLPNPEVTWLDNTLYNVGVDGDFWNGKLSFEFDVFYRLTEGIFGTNQRDVPSTFGGSLPQENINSRDDRGFDFVLNHRNQIGSEFSYSVSANVGWARQKWVKFSETEYTDPDDIRLRKKEENYTNRNIGYLSNGLFMTQADIDALPFDQDGNGNTTLVPGDIRYIDLNNDGVLDDRDRDDIGYGSTPDISYGLNLSAKYKNFSVAALFQGASLFSTEIGGGARGAFNNGSIPYDYQYKYSWRPDYNNPDTNINPEARLPRITETGTSTNNSKSSDFWLLDGTYLRLKSLNINYSLHKNLLNKLGFSSFDVYASATNLFSFNKFGIYKDTFDPEGPANQDGNSYPIMKTLTLGFKVTL
ncbi:SusC/RagA family TonB-linked outer membrane protein [Algibacter pacificus]|uniref:SusC/RagA family TonB-linked outer membrane protein n=1 Tax=Algibacter pacificus TaxID=2599389 RepID=UPI0011C8FC3C|nr:TonB-dependent receptor [Algibacter pacificus]